MTMFAPSKYTFFGKPQVSFKPFEEPVEEEDEPVEVVIKKAPKKKEPKYLPAERLLKKINEQKKKDKKHKSRQREKNISLDEITANSIERVMRELALDD